MSAHVWILAISGAVAIAALGLAGYAVSKMKKSSPARVAVVITALAGFVSAIPPLVSSFSALQG
ncbi:MULTISPECIES: hypothetical protein [Streptomyces]|uniref:hypothetical protein n=1 Tax=Streptomyces arenae TaxID=29301 RepID=UPI0026595197|nr:hypothetical protein [Streptomyces arenae]MCG7205006.1 hypothetical protein [Streptomyces arenae]